MVHRLIIGTGMFLWMHVWIEIKAKQEDGQDSTGRVLWLRELAGAVSKGRELLISFLI